MKTLILGIGNSILGDDGVGPHVAREVERRIADADVEVRDINVDGLNLFDFILDRDRLVVIDAILTADGRAGDIYRLRPEDVCDPSHTSMSPHHLNLATTLDIGSRLFPGRMPREVTVFAVSTQDITTVSERMSREVERAIPQVVRLVLDEVGSN